MRLWDPAAALPSEQEQGLMKEEDRKLLEVGEALQGEAYIHQVGMFDGQTWCRLRLQLDLRVVHGSTGRVGPASVNCPICIRERKAWEYYEDRQLAARG